MLALHSQVLHKGSMQSPTLGPILLAEDDENDVFFVRFAADRCGLCRPVIAVTDGRQAINYLEGFDPFQDRALHPFPSLLLLDLKMPVVSGFEVLSYCRARPHLRSLPICIISSSAQESDHAQARNLGADDFLVKPTDFRDLIPQFTRVRERWFQPPANFVSPAPTPHFHGRVSCST